MFIGLHDESTVMTPERHLKSGLQSSLGVVGADLI